MKKSVELIELENKIGDFIEYWGFKSIEGKIWLNIYISKNPLCAEDLMDSLNISKSLTSMSIKRLLDYNVILKSHTGIKGIQYYRANENVSEVIKNVIRSRERKMLNNIHSDIDSILSSKDHQTKENESVEIDIDKIKYLFKMTSNTKKFLNFLLFDFDNKNNFLSFGESSSETK